VWPDSAFGAKKSEKRKQLVQVVLSVEHGKNFVTE
jgi:hypothetical protein